MSYSVSVSGHTSSPEQEAAVLAAFDEAVKKASGQGDIYTASVSTQNYGLVDLKAQLSPPPAPAVEPATGEPVATAVVPVDTTAPAGESVAVTGTPATPVIESAADEAAEEVVEETAEETAKKATKG